MIHVLYCTVQRIPRISQHYQLAHIRVTCPSLTLLHICRGEKTRAVAYAVRSLTDFLVMLYSNKACFVGALLCPCKKGGREREGRERVG